MRLLRQGQPPERERPRAYGLHEQYLSAAGVTRGLFAKKAEASAPAELRIYEVIGIDFWTGEGVTAKDVAAKLDEIGAAPALNIYINSPGGEIFEAKAIIAQLDRFKGTKTVYVDGIAASAASFIAMVGDRIVTAPAATWMIHEVSCGAYGFASDLRKVADLCEQETKVSAGIYARRTGQTEKKCLELMAAETYMTAAEAKRLGFTDDIEGETGPDPTARVAANLSPAAQADLARARARAHSERFPEASPGQPGQPGGNAGSANRSTP